MSYLSCEHLAMNRSIEKDNITHKVKDYQQAVYGVLDKK
jgi:hypothetical protein